MSSASKTTVATNPHANLDNVVTPMAAWAAILPAWFLFSVLDASAKYVVLAGFAPLFVAWCRFTGHAVFICLAMRVWQHPERLKSNHPWLQILRGALLATGTVTNFLALQHLQLAQVMAIILAVPMVVTALSGPLLGEWAGWRRWFAVIVGFIGVLVVVRPGTSMFQWPILYSLVTLLAASLYFVMTRKMASTETDESMITYSGVVPALILLPPAMVLAQIPTSWDIWLALLVTGVCGAVGHLFLIRAHRLAPAPLIAPAVFSQILWSILIGYIVFSDLPDGWTVFGIAIISMSGFYIFNRERSLIKSLAAAHAS